MNTSFRRAALALAILASLAACDRAADTPQATSAPVAAEAPAAGTGIGIDLAGMDKAVQPGDDFDEYANGAWAGQAMQAGNRALRRRHAPRLRAAGPRFPRHRTRPAAGPAG